MTQNLAQTILRLMNESPNSADVAAVRQLEREAEHARQAAISASFMGADRAAAAIEKWNALERKLEAAVEKLSLHEATTPPESLYHSIIKELSDDRHNEVSYRDDEEPPRIDIEYFSTDAYANVWNAKGEWKCRVYSPDGAMSGTPVPLNIAKSETNPKVIAAAIKKAIATKGLHEAFGPTPNHPILPAVQALVKELNDIWGQAQADNIAKLVAERPYEWMQGVSAKECELQLSKHNRYVVVIPKQKYINIDIASEQNPHGGSGVFMVSAADGSIYGIKAYGTPNPIRRFGTVEKPDFGGLCMKLAISEGQEMQRLLAKRGIKAY
jgi:hypothetical protein